MSLIIVLTILFVYVTQFSKAYLKIQQRRPK